MREDSMELQEFELGPNILENLTTGMYSDSKIIYREYIQNACDQIDKAVDFNILESRKAGIINIFINKDTRSISIEDNATGISANDFYRTLMDIANSGKTIGQDKGFRGIGRMAGIAYCDKLIFTASAKGEAIKSILIFDAKEIRSRITENYKTKQYTLKDVWQGTSRFVQEAEDPEKHYFRVELQGVNKENHVLLDKNKIEEYLSFVAPVPYKADFFPSADINRYIKENNFSLDEYVVKLEGNPVVKPYAMEYDTHGKGMDHVRNLEFHTFKNSDGRVLAWGWIGVSNFSGSLPPAVRMRGIRIRSGNIQIGNDDVMQRFLTDSEKRGAYYFIGEIHIISKELIPNSQRDYFNENAERVSFESLMKKFAKNLVPIYHKGSEINSLIKAMEKADKDRKEFERRKAENKFLDERDAKEAENKVTETEQQATIAQDKLNKLKDKADVGVTERIIKQVAENRLEAYEKARENKPVEPRTAKKNNNKNRRRTDNLGCLSRKERKLVDRVFQTIRKTLDGQEDLSEKIITAIEDELK